MKRRVMAAVLCAALVFSGCVSQDKKEVTESEKSSQESEEQEDDAKENADQAKLDIISPSAYNNADGLDLEKGAYISVIGKAEDGAFWEEVKKGVEQAAEDINAELGYKGKDKVKVTYNGPSESENMDEQVNILDEELARESLAAVAISIADAKSCEVQFDLATENGIPIVAFDSGSKYKGLQAMISTDNKKAAAEAAGHMAESVSGQKEVVVIAHDSRSESAAVREKRFVKQMKKQHPEVNITGVYRLDEMQKTVDEEINQGRYCLDGSEPGGVPLSEENKVAVEEITQEDILDYILKQHPEVNGIYATNGDSLKETVKALDRAGKTDVCTIGYDVDEEELQALQDGKIQGLIVQNPYGMGYASVIASARASLQIGNEAYVDTGYIWVTKDNLEGKDIQKMLY